MNTKPTIVIVSFLLLFAANWNIAVADEQPKPASDVNWLADVVSPAELPKTSADTLRPLLEDSHGQEITTLAQWKERRKELRDAWLKFLGPMPSQRPRVDLKVLRTDELKGLTRQLVRYEAEAGQTVEGYLLRPAT